MPSDFAASRARSRRLGDRVSLLLIQSPHADFAELSDIAAGWHAHLGILADQLRDEKPRGFWTEHEEAAAHYARVPEPAAS